MILCLNKDASTNEIENLRERLHRMGFQSILQTEASNKTIAIVNGMNNNVNIDLFESLPLVEKAVAFGNKLKLVSKSPQKRKSIIQLKNIEIGRDEFIVMTGPCSIESREQIHAIAKNVSKSGAAVLRGGAFKPRTSTYDFQGLGEQGLVFLRDAADAYDMLCISEVTSVELVSLVASYVDILQIGARNMQNFSLLKAAGKCNKPVLLKRGLSATYHEFLSAAEYIMRAGNPHVILCERGIRTFETHCRNTLDIAAVPTLRELTHLPIMVDPSHGVGLRSIVPSMANAAIAVRADGVIVETHTEPDQSISDAAQTISTTTFSTMMKELRNIGTTMGLTLREAQT